MFEFSLVIVHMYYFWLCREKEELESSDESEDEMETEVTPGVKTKHDLMLKSEVSH